jgi:hypothetical protein
LKTHLGEFFHTLLFFLIKNNNISEEKIYLPERFEPLCFPQATAGDMAIKWTVAAAVMTSIQGRLRRGWSDCRNSLLVDRHIERFAFAPVVLFADGH